MRRAVVHQTGQRVALLSRPGNSERSRASSTARQGASPQLGHTFATVGGGGIAPDGHGNAFAVSAGHT